MRAQLATLNLGPGRGRDSRRAPRAAPPRSIRSASPKNGQVMRHCDPETLYNYAAGNYLLRPLERWQILGPRAATTSPTTSRPTSTCTTRSRRTSSSRRRIHSPSSQARIPTSKCSTTPPTRCCRRTCAHLFVNNPQIFDPMGTGNARIQGGIARRVERARPAEFRLRARHHRQHCRAARRLRRGRSHLAMGCVRRSTTARVPMKTCRARCPPRACRWA